MTFEIKDRYKTDNPIIVTSLGTLLVSLINFVSVATMAMISDLLSCIAPNHFVKFELYQIMTLWAGGMVGFLGLVVFFKVSDGWMSIGEKSVDNKEVG